MVSRLSSISSIAPLPSQVGRARLNGWIDGGWIRRVTECSNAPYQGIDEVEGDGWGQQARQGGNQPLHFGRVNTTDESTRKVRYGLGL